DGAFYGGDSAGLAAAGAAGIDHCAIVGAVTRRLNDDIAGKAKVVAKREQLGLARVAGGVLALGRVGKHVARPENVAMRVDTAPGQLKLWLARSGVPVQPSRSFFEYHLSLSLSWTKA